MVIDESHQTVPQIGGMRSGDKARKMQLINYGFRLPSALDNRPLTMREFERHIHQVVFMSATPGPWEIAHTKPENVVEQVIRPTGLLDPKIDVRPSLGQMDDLVGEINKRVARHERVFITTLTKRMAEDLTDYLKNFGIRVRYLHSGLRTLRRNKLLHDLREGKFDVLVGINLLREGIDVPEVSLVAILDADKEGFLRNTRSLVQTTGRASRNKHGAVIMYADIMTSSIKETIDQTDRRRGIQIRYNLKHHITPKTIQKPIAPLIAPESGKKKKQRSKQVYNDRAVENDFAKMAAQDQRNVLQNLRKEMQASSNHLDFEHAADLRDTIIELRGKTKSSQKRNRKFRK